MVADILKTLGDCKLVSIVRGVEEKDALATVDALYQGGIRLSAQ